MKTALKIVQITLVFFALAISGICQTWDIHNGFSPSSNPNGAWSFGRKWSVQTTAMDLFTTHWAGGNGWYIANGSPNMFLNWSPPAPGLDGPFMWNANNGNGLSCDRWTCPTTGRYSINGQFYAADSRGMDTHVYVVINGSIMFSSHLQSYPQYAPFSNAGVNLNQGDIVDFTIVWGGAGDPGNSSVTGVGGTITRVYDAAPALATANLVNGFVVGATITDGGFGYTNSPTVRFIGGGGSGAQAVTVISNGLVTAVNVLNPGSGYTNLPLMVIEPPYIPNPVLSIAPMTYLSFSNLNLGSVYQLQQWHGYYWSNQMASFTASNTVYTQIVAGAMKGGVYQLAVSPVPAQAFANAQVVNGFVVGITLTDGGSGYITNPPVTIVGAGSNATAVASISSSGVVTNITLLNPGIGYTNGATVQIGAPPNPAVSPTLVLPMMKLNSTLLAAYHNYQVQFKPDVQATWQNWDGGLFSTTGNETNTQVFFITNGIGYFRLKYLP